MRHRGKVSKDQGSDLWSGYCDCSLTWNHTRWQDAYRETFNHVRARRKAQALGVGFNSPNQAKTELETAIDFDNYGQHVAAEELL